MHSSLKIVQFLQRIESTKKLPSKVLSRASSSKSRIPSNLSRKYIPNADEMKEVFKMIDKDRDNKISVKDLQKVLTELRGKDMAEEAEKMVNAADSDRDGCINFKEFMEVHNNGGGIRLLEIETAFSLCDLDGDRRINAKDLEGLLKRLGKERSPEDCERMVCNVARDGKGEVDMDDFIIMMTKTMHLQSG
ncbi:calcium-binding protein CML24-like [Magnolia sinica]|uniref:calcium-binding protein CML24-like n=1 Tax=Magnolia sinica TaxID=86752 RepID=UPI002658444E|nr:calcium-binding protein CML24-like [Magnolia sinica]